MFAQLLKNALEAAPDRLGHPILLHTLWRRDGTPRERLMARVERHVAAHLELGPVENIDWSKIDWMFWIETIVKVLLALLPLL